MQEFDKADENKAVNQQEQLKVEPYRVGKKLELTAIPLEHMDLFIALRSGHPGLRQKLLSVIDATDGLITEYFPPELEKIKSTTLGPIIEAASNYTRIMICFGSLFDEMKNYPNKDVFVFDPAHDENFLYITLAPGILGIAGALLSIYPIAKVQEFVKKISTKAKKLPYPISRRDFLKVAVTTIVSLGMMSYDAFSGISTIQEWRDKKTSDFPLTEMAFRRVIVAKQIFSLADSLDTDHEKHALNLALVYPPVHWMGIRKLLDNRRQLEEQFKLWSLLRVVPSLENSFFTGRIYNWKNNMWQLKSEMKIP